MHRRHFRQPCASGGPSQGATSRARNVAASRVSAPLATRAVAARSGAGPELRPPAGLVVPGAAGAVRWLQWSQQATRPAARAIWHFRRDAPQAEHATGGRSGLIGSAVYPEMIGRFRPFRDRSESVYYPVYYSPQEWVGVMSARLGAARPRGPAETPATTGLFTTRRDISG